MRKNSRKKFLCLDCQVDTGHINEFYFVNTELWVKAVGSIDGMLCISCLETRIGRRLGSSDFPDVIINDLRWGKKSAKLRDRISEKT